MGMALVVVLVALAIVSAIGMTLVRMSLMHHRQAEREAFAVQSRWLAESAFDQSALRLKADGNASGFTWTIPAAELDGRHSAKVVVEIHSVMEAPQHRVVTVIAEFPENVQQRSRSRLVRQMEL